jgi:hypothetical protein
MKSSYKTSYTFLEGVGDFVKAKLGDKFPTNWGGFNTCLTPIPGYENENKYLFISRVFLTYDMLFSKKIVPGSKYFGSIQIPHMRPQDWSNYFPWGNWGNGLEMSIMFVGSIDNKKGFAIDETYTPFTMLGCKSHFQKPPCVYSQARELGIPSMLLKPSHQFSCSDFRIFRLGDDIIMHDAYTNYLNKVNVNHEKKIIRYEHWVSSVCQLPTSITGKDIVLDNGSSVPSGGSIKPQRKGISIRRKANSTKPDFSNHLTDGSPYYKYFDKNWSFIGMQGEQMLFLDWFYEDGVHTVSLDPTTGYCTRKCIVPFKKDPIPRDATEMFPDFSLGTTTMSISKGKQIDIIGVGHVKFHWDYVGFNGTKLYKEVARIDAVFNKTFGKNYKRHMKYVYAAFFYRIKQTSKNNFQMTMSNLWIPFFEQEKSRYHSLVFFPMGVTQSLSNSKEFLVSAGVTDYYNVVMTFNKEDVLSKLTHDISNMNMKKLYLDLIRY